MKRFLLDTNAAGHYMNRRRGVRERAAQEVARGNRIGICVPVLGELWFGVERSGSRDHNIDCSGGRSHPGRSGRTTRRPPWPCRWAGQRW